MSHLQMIHVPHINFHIWMSHGTHVNELYRQKKESLPCRSRVTHTRPSHVTRMNDPHQSHVTHMNEPCQTYEWTISESCHTCESVMFHVWIPTYGWVMSHVCITYITIMSHMWMSRVPRMNSHKWMSHATHKNQSCHAYEWTTSELCHTYKWVMSRVWIPKYEWAMSCTWTSHFENILASAMNADVTLYHIQRDMTYSYCNSCTSFEGSSQGNQPLNIFTRFVGAGGCRRHVICERTMSHIWMHYVIHTNHFVRYREHRSRSHT